jgi:hypothetical protein
MRTLALLAVPLLLASCGDDPQPVREPEQGAPATRQASPAPAVEPSQAARPEEGKGAASVLRRYYDLIEAGDYGAAWRMRGEPEEGAAAFARNFAAYERYRVTLGAPTRPVGRDGWLYAEVPIQIEGAMKGGRPFGSAGSVTMRRADGADAPPGQRGWHIYLRD